MQHRRAAAAAVVRENEQLVVRVVVMAVLHAPLAASALSLDVLCPTPARRNSDRRDGSTIALEDRDRVLVAIGYGEDIRSFDVVDAVGMAELALTATPFFGEVLENLPRVE